MLTSGLMLRTFQEILKVQPGFTSPEQVQVFGLAIPRSQVEKPERVVRMWNDILERLAAIPGVSAAGLASSLPMDDTKNQNPIIAENTRGEPGLNPPIRTFKFVSPGFLAATGTRLIAGRDLAWADIHGRRSVVLVSENLAKELWGSSTAAVGKRIHEMSSKIQWREVVGVVENVYDDGVQKPPPPTVYWPFAIANFNEASLNVQRNVAFAVRSPGAGTEAFLKHVRQGVAAVNPTSPVVRAGTLQEIYGRSMAQTSFALVMLAIAGGMAFVLGVIGVYGVISYTVERRRREVDIRMALGAPAAGVKRMFLRRGMLLAGVGIALGLAGALSFSRLISSLLFGVTPIDPATYGAATTVLLVAAMAATYIPARRAALVDPMDTLRDE
jgi:putative ABC transport system permease protein